MTDHLSKKDSRLNPRHKATIWVVEDEPDIACLFADILLEFQDYYLVCVDDASKVDTRPGDLIFLDMRGTKARKMRPQQGRLITMSGDINLNPTLSKPFSFDDIRTIVREHLARSA